MHPSINQSINQIHQPHTLSSLSALLPLELDLEVLRFESVLPTLPTLPAPSAVAVRCGGGTGTSAFAAAVSFVT